jgi:hypothetical protein
VKARGGRETPESYLDQNPTFRFRLVDEHKKMTVSRWEQAELVQLINRLKYFELNTWDQIRTSGGQGASSGGIGYKPLEGHPFKLPPNIPQDITLHEFRIGRKPRLYGFRDNAEFYIIWFDNEHVL